MDRLDHLEAFVAVVETGSFTAAADRLSIAKSAVSRRVSALEERLGVQLLRRTTRRLNLTGTGRSHYEHGARILADLEEAQSAVAQRYGELRGTLRMAPPRSFGIRHMCGPIAIVIHRHPRVTFELDFSDRRDVKPSMTASSGDFLCAAAAQGLGITLQPTFIAGDAIRRRNLVAILGNYQWPVTPPTPSIPRPATFRTGCVNSSTISPVILPGIPTGNVTVRAGGLRGRNIRSETA